MRRLRLDFHRRRAPTKAGYLVLVLGVACTLFVLAALRALTQDLEQSRLAAESQQRAGLGARAEAAAPDPAQARALEAARLVVHRLSLPWEALFAALEGIEEKDVALLALGSDAEKRQVHLSAEARNLEAMLRYHQKLQLNPNLADVALLDHEILEQERERPVRFNLSATWVGADHARE